MMQTSSGFRIWGQSHAQGQGKAEIPPFKNSFRLILKDTESYSHGVFSLRDITKSNFLDLPKEVQKGQEWEEILTADVVRGERME